MKRDLFLERTPGQTRLAVMEDGHLVEVRIERENLEPLTGNVYLGRIENVVPSLNAAFIDIGAEKNAFAHASDLGVPDGARIEKHIRPGQVLMVQVIKEPGGSKGCRVSTSITLAGEWLVLLAHEGDRAISSKITDAAERARMQALANALPGKCGAVLRTAAREASDEMLLCEWERLTARNESLQRNAQTRRAPCLLYGGGSLVERAVRDWLPDPETRLTVQNPDLYEEARAIAPEERKSAIALHPATATPLFDLFGVDAALEKAMGRYYWLDSGGSVVIDEAEALTAIDINTAKHAGKKTAEETIFSVNAEAAREIARLLRLKDIGGIILIDFIDMEEESHREAVIEILREALRGDRNKTRIHGFTDLGLLEMTRKKDRMPLSKVLGHGCEACRGTGTVLSYDARARALLREVYFRQIALPEASFAVSAPTEVLECAKKLARGSGLRITRFKDAPKPSVEAIST